MNNQAPAAAQSNRMGVTEWGLLLVHALLWGSAFFFAELAIPELPPLTITALRLLPAVPVAVSVCMLLGHKLPARLGEWGRLILLAAVLNVGPLLLILWAQREVTGGVAAVCNATAPLFGVFLAHALTRDEKLTVNKLAGILTGIAGVAVLVGADVFSGSTASILAKAALLAAAFCYAVGGVFARRFFAHLAAPVLAAGQLTGALILSFPLALAVEHPWTLPAPSWTALGALAGMGLFASALASHLYFELIRRAGASNALLSTILLPVSPVVLGALFLGETLSAREFAGALTIGLALLMIDGRLFAMAARRVAAESRHPT
jgi:drug/metabolite transporter (DMT)-like permease